MNVRVSLCFIVPTILVIISLQTPANKLCKYDRELFEYLHNDLNNDFLDRTIPVVQRMGDPRVYLAICSLLSCFGNDKMFKTGKMALSGFMETGLIVYSLKRVVGRSRPRDVSELDSFPSGHSAFAFTLAVITGHQYPRLKIPLYVLAFGTAFGRVYLGRHYPSDVIAGSLIGVLVGIQINHFESSIISLSF